MSLCCCRGRSASKKNRKLFFFFLCEQRRSNFSFGIQSECLFFLHWFYFFSQEKTRKRKGEREKEKITSFLLSSSSSSSPLTLSPFPRRESLTSPCRGPIVRSNNLAHFEKAAAVGVVNAEQQIDLLGEHEDAGARDGRGKVFLAQLCCVVSSSSSTF